MTPTHRAFLTVTQESLELFRSAIEGLPDAAADWLPAPGTNSLAVLVAHSVTSTRFWLRNGSGEPGSIARYREADRTPSFRVHGTNVAALVGQLDAFRAEAETILAAGTEEHLLQVVALQAEDPAEPPRSGVECLARAVAHLREHVGQAELMRDLWLGRT